MIGINIYLILRAQRGELGIYSNPKRYYSLRNTQETFRLIDFSWARKQYKNAKKKLYNGKEISEHFPSYLESTKRKLKTERVQEWQPVLQKTRSSLTKILYHFASGRNMKNMTFLRFIYQVVYIYLIVVLRSIWSIPLTFLLAGVFHFFILLLVHVGFTRQEVRVQLNNLGILTISGKQGSDGNDSTITSTRSRFSKEIEISRNYQPDQIRAKLSRGVLSIILPKLSTEDSKLKYFLGLGGTVFRPKLSKEKALKMVVVALALALAGYAIYKYPKIDTA